jgi:predicted Zn-dependent peptidase
MRKDCFLNVAIRKSIFFHSINIKNVGHVFNALKELLEEGGVRFNEQQLEAAKRSHRINEELSCSQTLPIDILEGVARRLRVYGRMISEDELIQGVSTVTLKEINAFIDMLAHNLLHVRVLGLSNDPSIKQALRQIGSS